MLGRSARTETIQEIKRCRVVGCTSEEPAVAGDGEGRCTAIGSCESTYERRAANLSSRQQTETR